MREENHKNETSLIPLLNKALDSIHVQLGAHFNLEGVSAATALSICCLSICGCVVLVVNGYPNFQIPLKYTYQNSL
jgi:hypothetical protein